MQMFLLGEQTNQIILKSSLVKATKQGKYAYESFNVKVSKFFSFHKIRDLRIMSD